MNPYRWQAECLEQWAAHNYHGIADIITGAGKTYLALSCMERLYAERKNSGCPAGASLRIKIVVPTVTLARQWRRSIRSAFPEGFGGNAGIDLFGDGLRNNTGAPVAIYVLNSARFMLARQVLADMDTGSTVLLIVDECHHCASRENSRIFAFMTDPRFRRESFASLGLSATPECPGYQTILVPALGPRIYRYGYADALRDRIISPFSVFQVALPFTSEEAMNYADCSDSVSQLHGRLMKEFPVLNGISGNAYFHFLRKLAEEEGEGSTPYSYYMLLLKRAEMIRTAAAREKALLALINGMPRGASVIVFCERIRQADEVAKTLEAVFPGRVGKYHSEMSKRRRNETLDLFAIKELRILVACKALDEGLDVPEASVGIILSGTSVDRQRIQRLGRILRVMPRKKIALLYYFYVEHSAEEGAYLPGLLPDIPTWHIIGEYDSEGALVFRFPQYEDAAKELLLRSEGQDASVLSELRRCIDESLTQPDFLLSEEEISRKINESADKHARNYWYVVREISKRLRR